MQTDFQRKWIQDERARKTGEINQKSKPKTIRLQHTKASIGHTKVPAPEPKRMFKMKQFENVQSRALALAGAKTIQAEPAEPAVVEASAEEASAESLTV